MLKKILKNKKIQIIIGVGLGISFMWLAIRNVDLNSVLTSIKLANLRILMIGFCIWLTGWLIRALRWQIILRERSPIAYTLVLRSLMVGFMGNNVLPLRAGEFIQAYLINNINKSISKSSALATVMVNRIFDGIAVVLFTMLGAISLPQIPQWLKQVITLGTLLFLGAFIVSLLIAKHRKIYNLLMRIIKLIIPNTIQVPLIHLIDNFILGLSTFKSIWGIGIAILLSIIIWGIEVVFYYFSTNAFGINLTLINSALVMGIVNLGVMIPTSPGAIGTYQFILIQVLVLFNISQSSALGLAISIQFLQNISVIIIGLYSLFSMGFTFKVFKQND